MGARVGGAARLAPLPILAALIAASTAWPGPGGEVSAQAGHVVINEVFYDAPSGWPEPEAEWIEIYNPTGADVDLSGWRLSDDPSPAGGDEGAYEFPPGASVPAGGYLTVAHSAAEFRLRYGVYPNFELEDTVPEVPSLIEVNPGMQLANSGDDVHLFDASLAEVDSAWYGTGGDLGAAGAAPDVSEGHSIEREPAGVDTDDCSADFVDRSPPTPLNPVTLTLAAVGGSGAGIAGVSFLVDGSAHSTGAGGTVSLVLPGGTHWVSAPSSVESGGITYFFVGWADGHPDDDRDVGLSADVTLTAVYSDAGMPGLRGEVRSASSEASAARSEARSAAEAAGRAEARVEALNESLRELEGEIRSLYSSLVGLEGRLAELERSTPPDLRGEVESLASSLGELRSALGELRSALGELNSTLESLEGRIGSLASSGEGLAGSVSDLRSRVGDLEGEVSELSARMGRVESAPRGAWWAGPVSLLALLIAAASAVLSLAGRGGG